MFPLTATTGANLSKSLRTSSWVKSPACTMSMASWKTSKTLDGIALARDGMCVSEIKPTIFKRGLSSLDLSLSPKVVGALAPAVNCSLQRAGSALRAVEGSEPANPLSQPANSSTRQERRLSNK